MAVTRLECSNWLNGPWGVNPRNTMDRLIEGVCPCCTDPLHWSHRVVNADPYMWTHPVCPTCWTESRGLKTGYHGPSWVDPLTHAEVYCYQACHAILERWQEELGLTAVELGAAAPPEMHYMTGEARLAQ